MVRSPSYESENLKKGPWTPEEDEKLIDYIKRNGHTNWKALPKRAGLNRCGKSCRLRWINYLKPDIKRGRFSEEEERIILNLHSVLGNKWSRIAAHLPGRTDNEVKNFWNTHMRKKLLQMGLDPNTHKPTTSDHDNLNHLLNLYHFLIAPSPQLGTSSMITPWDINLQKLKSQLSQLTQIKFLQNLLHITNPSNCSLPIPENISLSPSGTLNFEALEGSPQAPNHEFQALANSWEGFEGGFGEGGCNINHAKSFSSSCYDIQAQNPLPELVSVSASPETSIVNMMETHESNPSNHFSGLPSPTTSSVFEALEKFMNEETSGSCWKDFLN